MHLLIEEGSLTSFPTFLPNQYSTTVLICDSTAHELVGSSIEADHLILLPPGEGAKRMKVAEECWERLAEWGCDRDTLIIALGGGGILDLAAFVASTYMRGLPLCLIPTTLLAMVDAAIGGKTAINLAYYKNYIGTFYQPIGVLMDPLVLRTLPRRTFVAGLAEVVKHGLLDPDFFFFLEEIGHELLTQEGPALTEVIRRSIAIKQRIVEGDVHDRLGKRISLNLGHTVGHALEGVLRYSLPHGEAVSMGIVAEVLLGTELGITSSSILPRLCALCRHLGLPTLFPQVSINDLWTIMERDKKRSRKELTIPLLEDFGKIKLVQGIPKEAILRPLALIGALP